MSTNGAEGICTQISLMLAQLRLLSAEAVSSLSYSTTRSSAPAELLVYEATLVRNSGYEAGTSWQRMPPPG
jgi:hypothetical protein